MADESSVKKAIDFFTDGIVLGRGERALFLSNRLHSRKNVKLMTDNLGIDTRLLLRTICEDVYIFPG